MESGGLMTWETLYAQPPRSGALRIACGPGELQTDIAKCSIMQWIASDLAARGYAVWNIEYRGVDRAGGGYPGTILDVAAAADKLREVAPRYRLKLDRVVATGHSAGGIAHSGLRGDATFRARARLHSRIRCRSARSWRRERCRISTSQ